MSGIKAELFLVICCIHFDLVKKWRKKLYPRPFQERISNACSCPSVIHFITTVAKFLPQVNSEWQTTTYLSTSINIQLVINRFFKQFILSKIMVPDHSEYSCCIMNNISKLIKWLHASSIIKNFLKSNKYIKNV